MTEQGAATSFSREWRKRHALCRKWQQGAEND